LRFVSKSVLLPAASGRLNRKHMKRYFLDTTAWLDLLKQERSHAVDDAFRSRTVHATECSWIEIVVNEEVLDELLPERVENERRFLEDFVPVIAAITHDLVLIHYGARMELEFDLRHNLSFRQSFYDKGLTKLASDPRALAIPGDVKDSKKRHVQERETEFATLADVKTSMPGGDLQWNSEIGALRDGFVEWVDDLYEQLCRQHGVNGKKKRLRTAHSDILFKAAVKLLAFDNSLTGQQRRKMRRIYLDRAHFVDARSSGCDYIVSDDTDIHLVSRLTRKHFSDSPQAICFKDFMRHVSMLP
jgi:hypothetical protein